MAKRFYFDTDLGFLTSTRAGSIPLELMDFMSGDSRGIEVELFRNGVEYVPTTVEEMIFVIKAGYKSSHPALAYIPTDGWSVAAGIYSGTLVLGEDIRTPLGGIPSKTFLAQITATLDGVGPMTSRTARAVVGNDLWKGTEGTPSELPDPDTYVRARAVVYDAAQTLTTEEQAQALANIGAGTAATTDATAYATAAQGATADAAAAKPSSIAYDPLNAESTLYQSITVPFDVLAGTPMGFIGELVETGGGTWGANAWNLSASGEAYELYYTSGGSTYLVATSTVAASPALATWTYEADYSGVAPTFTEITRPKTTGSFAINANTGAFYANYADDTTPYWSGIETPAGTYVQLAAHAAATDPHGDRAYADALGGNYATAAQGATADAALPKAGGTMTGGQTFASTSYVIFDSSSYASFTNGSQAIFASGTIKLEGTTYTTSINFTDPTSDKTITFQDATGTIAHLQNFASGTITPYVGDLDFSGGLGGGGGGDVTLTGVETLTNKTLTAPTINSGALSGTFSGSATLSGAIAFASTTRPTTSGTGVPASNSLTSALDVRELIARDSMTREINLSACSTFTSSGTVSTTLGYHQLYTSATASAFAMMLADAGALGLGANLDQRFLDFDRRMVIRVRTHGSVALRSGIQFYFQLGRTRGSSTPGLISGEKGFGVGITGSTVTPYVHDGTTLTTTLATGSTFSWLTYPEIILDYAPGSALSVWGIPYTSSAPVLLAAITSGLPSGLGGLGKTALEFMSYDTGAGGAAQFFYLSQAYISIF